MFSVQLFLRLHVLHDLGSLGCIITVENWLDVQDKLGLKRKLSFLPEEFKVQIRFPENQTIECSEFKDAMQFITVVSVSLHIRTPKTHFKFDAF